MNKIAKFSLIGTIFLGIIILLIVLPIVFSGEQQEQPVIWNRGISWDLYKNPDGTYTKILYSGEVNLDLKDKRYPNYVPWNSSFFPIINSTYKDYEYELDTKYSDYQAYFQNDIKAGKGFRFEVDGYWFTYDLSGGKIQWSEQEGNPTKTKSIGAILSSFPSISGSLIKYTNSFLVTDVQYEMILRGVKENFILKSAPSVSGEGYLYLSYTGELQFDGNLSIWANGEQQDGKSFITSGQVEFRNSIGVVFMMPSPSAIDSANNSVSLVYDIKPNVDKLAFGLKIPYDFLLSAVYPVFIDPTVTYSNTTYINDTFADGANPTNTRYTATRMYLGTNPVGTDWRAFIQFKNIDLTHYSSIGESNLSLYNVYGPASSGGATYYMYNVTSDWSDTTLTYNNQPTVGVSLDSKVISQYYAGWVTYNVTSSIVGQINNIRGYAFDTEDTNGKDGGFSTMEYTDVSLRPILTLTYTPYIDIISPIPSQIFTEDAPTARFNVTTTVAMDECRWSNNTGTTNYSMTAKNSTYFYNNTAGSILLDSSAHQVTFYCNQSDDGTWRISDTIDFEIDPVNITKCRNLNVNREYQLINNLTDLSATGNYKKICLDILNDSSLNANGRAIVGTGNYYMYNDDPDLRGYDEYGIHNEPDDSKGNLTIKNFKFYNLTTAIFLDVAGNYTITNNSFYLVGVGIYLDLYNVDKVEVNVTNNRFYNKSTENAGYNNHSIWLSGGLKYVNFIDNIDYDNYTVGLDENGAVLYAINSTYNHEEIQADISNLTRQWYFDANVTDTNTGEKLQNANITVKDLSGAVVLSLLTDVNGDINRQELTEYINNGGTKTYKTSHNVSISKTGYQTNSTLINITTLNNIFYETNIEKNILGIKIFSPSNSTYNNRTAYFNVSVERNISLCRYTINSWTTNYTLTRYNDSYYYASNTSIPDGSFRARFWCNDTNNIVNNTEYKDFSVDATSPLISYNSNTDSATYVNRNWIFINVTASDANKDTVRLDWSTIGNETFDNSGGNYYWENKTGLANGAFSFYAWINDTAGNKNVTALRTITVDTIKPSIVFKYPTNITYNVNVSNLNYTYSDTNPSSCWYSRDIGITNSTAITAGINFSNTISIEGTNNYTLFCNDSANNLNTTTLYFYKDTVLPVIINGTGTELSGVNFTRTNVYVNVSITELNEKNITFLLYKSGIINETGFTTAIRDINWTGLSDGVYYYNVTVIDTSGNTNTSMTRRIGLDNMGPVVTIEHPKAQSYSTTNFSLNYTVSDATTYVSICWFKVENASVYLTISNTTIPCANTTFNLTADGNYNLTFYANDSLNKLTTKVVAFSLSTSLPSVVLDSPKENEWLKTTSITFNFTATDAHTFDNNCSLWGDWTGTWHKNYTWHIPNSGLQNYTTVILTEGGSYKYNVFCNESNGVASWGLTNVTFGIDQTFPQVKTVYPTNTTYTTTISVFNYTYTDTNPGSCWYSKDRGAVNSTSVLAGINFTGITSIEGSNNYTLFCNDTANNINSSTIYFTIESTPPVIAVVYPSNINYNINVSNLNYTYSDTNPGSCWYSRDIGTTNSTSIVAGINWSNVKSNEGTNNYTLYCNDTSNLLSSSLITFYKDTIFPQTNITYPQNKSYNIELIYLNYTYSDTNPSSCWYSRDIGITNLSIVDAGFNFSYVASVESSNNWTLFCNDTFGNLNTTTLYFYKDMGLPLISIVYPENTTYVMNVSNLNYTVSDLNLESCWYSRNKSISNISITCGNNVSDIISEEENNTYTVWANDTSGNINSHTINFLKDTVLPEILIIDPINGSVFSDFVINISLNISVNYSDITGYWWNYNDGPYNYSFTLNTTMSWAQMPGTTKTYILSVWANDTHNNTAYNTSTFTMIVLKSGGISGGGGGGGGKVVTVEKIIKGAVCGNEICEEGEYFYNCPQDCGQNLDTLFLNCFSKDPVKRETCAWNKATALTWAFILTAVFVTIYIGRSLYKKYKKEKPKQIY